MNHQSLIAALHLLSSTLFLSLSPALVRAQDPPSSPASPNSLPIAQIDHQGPVDFQTEILPIFKNNCLACHNQTKAKAGLILETPQTILTGGDSGPAVVPNQSAQSLLLKIATHQDEDTIMPPKNNKVAAADLSPKELALLKLWIDQGATGEIRSQGPIDWQPLPPGINPIYALAITPDGQFVACGRANQIFLYHIPSHSLVTRLTDPALLQSALYGKPGAAHHDLVHALQFSPDGTLLASAGYREVKLWRRPSPAHTLTLTANHPVQAVAASSDGKWTATASDNTIIVRDAPAGNTITLLSGHTQTVTSLAFSPDNSFLLSGSADKSLRVWTPANAKTYAQTTTPTEIQTVTWLPDGKQLAAAGTDKIIRLWQLPDQPGAELAMIKELTGHDDTVTSLAPIPTSNTQLLSGSTDGSLRLWDLEKAEQIRKLDHGGPVTAVAARPDGKVLASAGLNNLAKLWATEDGKELAIMKGDTHAYQLASSMERSQTLASAELDYQNRVLKEANETEKKENERLAKATEAVKESEKNFSEKQTALAAATEPKTIADKELAALTEELTKTTQACELAANAAQQAQTEAEEAKSRSTQDQSVTTGKIAEAEAKSKTSAERKEALDKLTAAHKEKEEALNKAIKEAEKNIEKAEKELTKADRNKSNAQTELDLAAKSVEATTQTVAKGKEEVQTAEAGKKTAESELETARKTAADSERPIRSLAFSPDNLLLASVGDDQAIHTWSAQDGAAFDTFPTEQGSLSDLAFLNPNRLLCASSDGSASVWDFNARWTLERILGTGDASSPFIDRVNALDFTPDGQTLATGGGEPSRSGEILLWQVDNGKLIQPLKEIHSDTVLDLAFSPNGRYLASASADRFLRVTDLSTGSVIKAFEGHTHHVLGVSWTADARTLASAGADNMIKIWDFTTGERKKNIEGFNKEVTSIHFAGVTDQALATSGDSKVRLISTDGKDVRSFDGASDFVYTSAITPDGQTVVAAGQDSTLRIWNGKDGKLIASFPAPTDVQ